jgi:hypothetical protein
MGMGAEKGKFKGREVVLEVVLRVDGRGDGRLLPTPMLRCGRWAKEGPSNIV